MKSILFVLFIGITFFSLGTDIFVDQSNTSTGNGSIGNPYQTISEAINSASPNDRILINGGIYRETLSPAFNNLTIEALDDDVYVTGTDIISNWIDHGDGIYKSFVPQECTQVFAESIPQLKARYPNTSSSLDLFEFNTIPVQKSGTTVTLPNTHPITSDWIDGTIWMLVDHRWLSVTGKITDYSNNQLELNYLSTEFDGASIAYITNTIAALDTVGEWHWQNDTLYYFFGNTGDISNTTIEAQTRATVMNLNNRDEISIDGIHFYSGNVLMNNTTYSTIRQCDFKYLNNYHYINKDEVSWYSSYGRTEWTNINSLGLGIGIFGSNNTVDECELSWSSGDCITLFGNDNTVSNCTIHDANYFAGDMAPIAMGGQNNIITHNHIYNAGRDVIAFLSAESFKITYNRIHTAGLLAWDLGCLYCYNTDGKGAEIAYNWVYDARSGNPETFWGAQGIYLDNNSRNYSVHHNVIWDCKGGGIQLNMPANNLNVYNNTSFNCERMLTYLNPTFSGLISGDCNFTNNYLDADILIQPWLSLANNLQSTTDHLEDRAGSIFVPMSGSPLVDAGTEVDPTLYYKGSAPDIGAYEANGTIWGAGPHSVENTGNILGNFRDITVQNESLGHPNPTQGKFELTNSSYETFELFDTTGKLIKSGKVIDQSIQMNDIPVGTYTLKVSNGDHVNSTKIVKQ